MKAVELIRQLQDLINEGGNMEVEFELSSEYSQSVSGITIGEDKFLIF